MKSIFRSLMVLGLSAGIALNAATAATAAACAAGPFVNAAGSAILRAARSRSPAALASAASHYGDIHGLALFSLGQYRKNLSREREAEYVALTRNYIGRFLARHSSKVSATGLSIVSCAGSESAPTVTVRLSSGGKAVFRLYKTRRGYMMRDVNIASIWLGAQMRSTFTSIIQKNGGNLSGLFAFLRG